MYFEEKLECAVDPDVLWDRVSDLDSFTKYWHGTRSLTWSRTPNSELVADIVFAFGGRGKAKIEVDGEHRVLTINFVEGPFRGVQKVWVGEGGLGCSWNVEFAGAYRILGGFVENHFRQGTLNALKRLCEDRAEP